MDREAILKTIQAFCAGEALSWRIGLENELFVQLPSSQLRPVVAALIEQHDLRHLSAITALQVETGIEVLYHFWQQGGLTIILSCPQGTETLPSIADLLPAADWYEREVHDLFGLAFAGHPHLSPLLLPEDWDGPPPFATRGEEK